jgi:Bacterial regulatory helix-turn-helix protein, lysR family
MVRPRLPPLNAIKAFEAAARLGSFTRAAEELNVTHGAVSRQICLLEDWLGVRLFLRTSLSVPRLVARPPTSPRCWIASNMPESWESTSRAPDASMRLASPG